MSTLLTLLRREGYKPSAVQTEALEQKRKAAIEWMGTKWCLHPMYQHDQKREIKTWKS